MRLLLLTAVLATQLLPQPTSQSNRTADHLHMMIGCSTCGSAVHLTALNMQREAPAPAATKVLTSVIQLRGDVEIKTQRMALYADEASYHEDTGEIEAHGNVRVKLGYQHRWTK
jgi:lipopolysaccharide assembly outer membrane protein LptD (OstA)